ncbi:MAG: hypothetical protein ACLQLH_03420 [Terracidiphilus sp.]
MNSISARIAIGYQGTPERWRNLIIAAYTLRFDLTVKQAMCANFAQIGACKSDEARRLLLGISQRNAPVTVEPREHLPQRRAA